MRERPSRPTGCPWHTYPTHARNRELQVNGDRPIIYGHCPQNDKCAFCAGTLYKPNLLLQVGRPFLFVPCPYCSAEPYRKRVDRLRAKLPKGSGPPPPSKDAPPPPAPPEGEPGAEGAEGLPPEGEPGPDEH